MRVNVIFSDKAYMHFITGTIKAILLLGRETLNETMLIRLRGLTKLSPDKVYLLDREANWLVHCGTVHVVYCVRVKIFDAVQNKIIAELHTRKFWSVIVRITHKVVCHNMLHNILTVL